MMGTVLLDDSYPGELEPVDASQDRARLWKANPILENHMDWIESILMSRYDSSSVKEFKGGMQKLTVVDCGCGRGRDSIFLA